MDFYVPHRGDRVMGQEQTVVSSPMGLPLPSHRGPSSLPPPRLDKCTLRGPPVPSSPSPCPPSTVPGSSAFLSAPLGPKSCRYFLTHVDGRASPRGRLRGPFCGWLFEVGSLPVGLRSKLQGNPKCGSVTAGLLWTRRPCADHAPPAATWR